MLKLLAFLWSGCWHKWKIIAKGSTVHARGGLPCGNWYDLQCERCGNVKRGHAE